LNALNEEEREIIFHEEIDGKTRIYLLAFLEEYWQRERN
jgi:hypothetical protein